MRPTPMRSLFHYCRIHPETVAAELPTGPVKETVDKRRHLLFQAKAPKKLSTAAFVIERERVSEQDLSVMEPHPLKYPANDQTAA